MGSLLSNKYKRVNPVLSQQRLMQKQELWTVSRLFESASYVSLGDPDGPGWEAIVKVCECQDGVKTPMLGFPGGLGRRGVPRRWCPSVKVVSLGERRASATPPPTTSHQGPLHQSAVVNLKIHVLFALIDIYFTLTVLKKVGLALKLKSVKHRKN